jgi:outer membrane protein, heavy metal efflux system
MRQQRPQRSVRCGGNAVGWLLLGAGMIGGLPGLIGCTPDQFFAESIPVSHSMALVRIADTPQSNAVIPVSHQSEDTEPKPPGDKDKAEPPEMLPTPKQPPGPRDQPASPTGPGLTLDQAINTCLLADPKIRAGLEAINQANADATTASLKPNPTLLADGQLLPLRRFTVDRQGGPPQQDVQVGYPIDWFVFGKRAAAMVFATLGVRVSEADYADLIRQRVTDTAVGFYDVLEAKALVELARQDVKNFGRVEESIRKAFEAGGRPRVDLNRIQLDLLSSRQRLREAESALVAAKAKLRAFLGRTDGDPAFDVAGSLDAPLTAKPLPIEEAFQLAVQNRPDIQSLRWKIAQARADIKVQHTKAFPDLTPTFGYTHQYQREAIGFPDADSWSVSVQTSLPFFDRNQGNRAKAASVAVQSQYDFQSGLVDLRSEIETVINEFRTARANANAVADEQLRLAEQVRQMAIQGYAGGRPLLEVLDAERNYRDTYRLYINSRADYWRSLYRFNGAIGKQVLR